MTMLFEGYSTSYLPMNYCVNYYSRPSNPKEKMVCQEEMIPLLNPLNPRRETRQQESITS